MREHMFGIGKIKNRVMLAIIYKNLEFSLKELLSEIPIKNNKIFSKEMTMKINLPILKVL